MAFVYWIYSKHHDDLFTQGYIGVTTTSIEKRMKGHRDSYKKLLKTQNRPIFHKAIDRYGFDEVIVRVICESSEEYAYWLEKQLRPFKGIGWNTAVGGDKPPGFKGFKCSEETKKKISDANKGRKRTKEQIEKTVSKLRGRKLSEDKKSKISKGLLGRKPSKKSVDLLIERNKARRGSVLSEETKLKISNSLKGCKMPDGFGRKVSERQTGIPFSKERKKNISISKKKSLSERPWKNSRANLYTWMLADFLYKEIVINKNNVSKTARFIGYADSGKLETVIKKFKLGWIPSKDPFWLEDFQHCIIGEN